MTYMDENSKTNLDGKGRPLPYKKVDVNDDKQLTDTWLRRCKSVYEYTKKMFDDECRTYLEVYAHKFEGLLPKGLTKSGDVDVNMVFPIVKSLVPALYFRDPKVFAKPEEEFLEIPVLGEDGQPLLDELGNPIINTYDGLLSARKFQEALNNNITDAKLKQQAKSCILDAHLTFYGAAKLGVDNEQGVASMGGGAPPSVREDVNNGLAFACRLKPWNVICDPNDWYNPSWMGIRHCVHPEQLRQDERLQGTEMIRGNASLLDEERKNYWKYMSNEETIFSEYYELYVKPCAEYREGLYLLLSDEVKDMPMFKSMWAYQWLKSFPVRRLYFNPDPLGGFPIPDVRYYIGHQKAKVNIRNAEYEFVQRTMPCLGIDETGVKDKELVKKQVTSGQIPRMVLCTRPPDKVLRGVSYPSLSIDFRNFDNNLDNDVSRVVGMVSNIAPAMQQDQIATGMKIAATAEQVRNNERADVVYDFLQDIIDGWKALYKEFMPETILVPVEGEKYPMEMTKDEALVRMRIKVKPFSMNYEDPIILRRQWTDLLNLFGSPQMRAALAEQGSSIDVVKVAKKILSTFDEQDVESFVIDKLSKPEEQVADAISENQAIAQGQQLPVKFTDNDKLHIIIHGMLGEAALEHVQMHQQQALAKIQGQTSGGGNQEGLPINGVAINQDMMKEPTTPSSENEAIALAANAKTGER